MPRTLILARHAAGFALSTALVYLLATAAGTMNQSAAPRAKPAA